MVHNAVLVSLVLGCASGAGGAAPARAPTTAPAPATFDAGGPAATDGAAAASAPRPLPAVTTVHVELPGAPPGRHLHVRVDIGGGARWLIEGCVTDAGGVCTRTRAVELNQGERVEYIHLWQAIYAMALCEPEAVVPGDRAFELEGAGQRFAGHLPADPAQIEPRAGGPCRAPARLAAWVARRFGALPAP